MDTRTSRSPVPRDTIAGPGRALSALALGLLAVLAAGCGQKNEFVPPPPPKVAVANPVVRNVTRYANFTGKTASVASVEIRARVQGWLQKRHFEDGQLVRKGEVLFTIDPREYEAAVQQAEAELLNAKTALAFAENDLARREKAFAENAISELDLLRSRAERDKALARVAAAEAELEKARISLSYCTIRTPITGKTSRRLVDVGNLVGAGEPTLLTTVTQIVPIFAYFNVSERDVNRLLQHMAELRETLGTDVLSNPGDTVPVELGTATEAGYPHHGTLDFVDNRVDPETGTMEARALFPNHDVLLLPGIFVRIRVPSEEMEDALLIPEAATAMDQQGRYVLVVNERNVVERRSITVGPREGELVVALEGLSPDDRVVVNGLLNARPGSEVTPEKTEIVGTAVSGGGAAGEEAGTGEAPAEPGG